MQGRLVLTAPDGDGVPTDVSTGPDGSLTVPTQGEQRVLLYARIGRAKGELKATLLSADRVIARRVFSTTAADEASRFPPALLSTQQLIVVIGPDATAVDDAAGLGHQESLEKALVVRLPDCGQLPTEWYGYEGVDSLVLETSQADTFAGVAPTDPRVKALDRWVQMGGRVVLCAGRSAEQVIGPGRTWSCLAPGRLEQMTSLRQTGALETYTGSSTPIPPVTGDLRVPQVADALGMVEARESSLPLVTRQTRGFGQVVFLALDPESAPLAQWPDRGRLMARLLDLPTQLLQTKEDNQALLYFGFTDIAGQLRSALDQFSGVQMMPFWAIVGLVIGYMVLIGPGDYFLLRKVIRRMEATWITFPLIVAVVVAGTYGLGQWLKGGRVRVNQVDLVDVDAGARMVRGTTWLNVLSSSNDRYNLSIRPQRVGGGTTTGAAVHMSWLGLPGEALGGMNPKAADPNVWRTSYAFDASLGSLSGVPIPVWCSKSFTARWSGPANLLPQAQLVDEDRIPTGTITNTLPFALDNALLAYGTWAYDLGRLEPGQSVDVGSGLMRRELKTLLTGRKVNLDDSGNKIREEVTPYDQGSVDVRYILRAMMFYHAAGGRGYTGMWNRFQDFVDSSSLLQTDRAVLVGSVPDDLAAQYRGADLLRDGHPLAGPHDQHTTLFRFVFPVKQGG